MKNLKSKTISGLKWESVDRLSVQLVQFVLGVILARILSPNDFGLVAMLTIFMALAQTLLDSGFSNALICKKNRDDVDYSTTFYFNIAVGVIIYIILYVGAPFISAFYSQPILNSLLRVLAVIVIINSFAIVPIAKLTINLNFKAMAIITLISALISGILGVVFALRGFGVWSLVVKSITERICFVIILFLYLKWLPKLIFSVTSFKSLFSFGSKIMLSGILNTVYLNMSSLVVGKFYTSSELGYFSRGEQFASLPGQNISAILKKVTFPVLSEIQKDEQLLLDVYRKYISSSSLVVFFVMILLASVAKPLILLILTEKWSEAILFMQIFCFTYMFNHISDVNLNLLQVKGRSDLFLKVEIIKKTISFIMLFASVPFGMIAIAMSRVLYTQIALIINTYYTGKLFGIGYICQLKDFSPYFVKAFLSCIPSFIICNFVTSYVISLLLGGTISIVIYYLFLRNDVYFKEIIKIRKNGKK